MPFDEEGDFIPSVPAPAGPIDYDPDAWMYEPGGPYYTPPAAPTPQPDYSTMPWQDLTPEQMQALQQGAAAGAYDVYGDFASAAMGSLPEDVTAALQQGFAQGQGWGLSTPNPDYYPSWGGGDSLTEDGGGGDGGGDGGGLPSNFWEETYSIQGAPSWWRGLTARDQNPETEYASLMNAMIPFLSPEDQRNVAVNLWSMYPTWFESYNPDTWTKTTPAEYETDEYGNVILDEEGKPKVKTPEQVDLNPWARPEQAAPLLLMQEYTSTRAAEQQLAALQSMAKAMGLDTEQLGPGFKYIQQIASAIKGFGANKNPEEGWTRTQKEQYMNTLDPLLAASQSSGTPLSAYAVLAKMMTQPTFSNMEAPLWPYKDPQTGELVWAAANPQMY